MAVVSTGLSVAGIRSEFFERFNKVKTHWQDLSTRIKSTTKTEHHRWLGSVPQVREWGTGRLAKGIWSESYDIADRKYEATLEVDREELEDDQLGQIVVRVRE